MSAVEVKAVVEGNQNQALDLDAILSQDGIRVKPSTLEDEMTAPGRISICPDAKGLPRGPLISQSHPGGRPFTNAENEAFQQGDVDGGEATAVGPDNIATPPKAPHRKSRRLKSANPKKKKK